MHIISVARLVAVPSLLLGLAGSASAEDWQEPPANLRHGDYNCTTRNGRVLEGRGFTIIDDRHYAKGDSPGGTYLIQGDRVYFDLGELDGKQVRILSTGRIKYSSDIFCVFAGGPDEMIPEGPQSGTAAPADQALPADAGGSANPTPPPGAAAPAGPPPASAPQPEPVPPKVIKVDPNQADPRLQPVAPP
jgi:hypothetical protein